MPDAPALGCAILAAVAAGLHPDIPSAAAAMVRIARTVLPDHTRHQEYRRLFKERYQKLYPALKPIFHQGHGAPASGDAAGGGAAGGEGAAAPALQGQRPTAAADGAAARQSEDAAWPPPPRPIISPSILAADFAALGDEVERVLAAGADWVHVDMFDGGAIAGGNFTIGPCVVAALRKRAPGAFLDCHLAVEVRGGCTRALAGDYTCQAASFFLESLDPQNRLALGATCALWWSCKKPAYTRQHR